MYGTYLEDAIYKRCIRRTFKTMPATRVLNEQIMSLISSKVCIKNLNLITSLKGSSKETKIFSLPYKFPLCFIDHRLIVNHVCVVAQGVIREQFLIFKLICNNIVSVVAYSFFKDAQP